MSSGVCVLGDPAVDLVIHLPEEKNGMKVMPQVPHLYPGGSGSNTAVALARLGVQTQFIGTAGEDQYGQLVIDDFRRENVNIDQLFIDPELATVCVFAFVDKDGERFLWGWPLEKQSYKSINFEDINLDRIKQAGWLHTTGLLLLNESSGRLTALKTLEWGSENGVITSFDLNLRVRDLSIELTFQDIVERAIASTKVVLGSEREFAELHPSLDWQKKVDELLREDKIVVVRRGDQGALLFAEKERIEVPAFPVQIMDTVGAGDVFNAGFIAALLREEDYATALQWGNAVAAYTIKAEGARTSPTFDQMQEFVKRKTPE